MNETAKQFSTTMLAHKGEVVLAFSIPVSNWFMPPQVARDVAAILIKTAEAAEQQMDAQEGR